MMNVPWTETRKAEAAKLWNEGYSAKEIAMQFCVSRNAVIGVATRNRDLFAKKVGGNQTRKPRISTEPRPVYKRVMKSPSIALPKFETPSEAPISRQLTLVERGLFECVFPTHSEGTRHLYCGHTTTKAEWYYGYHTRLRVGGGTVSERRAAA